MTNFSAIQGLAPRTLGLAEQVAQAAGRGSAQDASHLEGLIQTARGIAVDASQVGAHPNNAPLHLEGSVGAAHFHMVDALSYLGADAEHVQKSMQGATTAMDQATEAAARLVSQANDLHPARAFAADTVALADRIDELAALPHGLRHADVNDVGSAAARVGRNLDTLSSEHASQLDTVVNRISTSLGTAHQALDRLKGRIADGTAGLDSTRASVTSATDRARAAAAQLHNIAGVL